MSSIPTRWTPLKYHPLQWAAWTSKARAINLACGRGSGKTELARRKIVLALAQKKEHDKPLYFYAMPTYGQAKRVAWKHLVELIPKHWIKKVNVMDLYIETIFGSELYVMGMDQPQRLEGVQIDGIVVDEACDHKPESFDLSIKPTLSWRNAWSWRIGVPKRSGNCSREFKEAFDLGLGGRDPDVESYSWPSSDVMDPAMLEYARRTMDPKDYLEQYEANWVQAGGLIFYTFDRDLNTDAENCVYNQNLPLRIGMDFNVDPMSWVICQKHLDNSTKVIDELSIRNTNTPECMKTLLQRYAHHKGAWFFYPDASSTARKTSASVSDYVHIINSCKAAGLNFHIESSPKNPSLANRFSVTNAALCNVEGDRRVLINPKCKKLIADLDYRAYKPGCSEPNDSGDIGHMSDAFGYYCWKEYPLIIPRGHSPSIAIRSF